MADPIFRFNKGDLVKDTITSFKGIVYGRSEWFNGCVRYTLLGEKLTKDGKPVEAAFDDAQLVLITAGKKKPPAPVKGKPTGGPFNTPPQVGLSG